MRAPLPIMDLEKLVLALLIAISLVVEERLVVIQIVVWNQAESPLSGQIVSGRRMQEPRRKDQLALPIDKVIT